MMSLPPKCAHSKKKKGFSLIEAAVVLGVVGVVIGGIWVAASSVIDRFKENKFVEGAVITATNIQSFLSSYEAAQIVASNGGVSTEIQSLVFDAGKFPQDYTKTGTTVKHPFADRAKAVLASGHVTGANASFEYWIYGVPYSLCVRLAARLSATGRSKYMVIHPRNTRAFSSSEFPLTPTITGAECTSGQNNTVVTAFYFER